MTTTPMRILMSGLPGRMAAETALRLAPEADAFELLPVGMSGDGADGTVWRGGGMEIVLFGPRRRADMEERLRDAAPHIAVDYSTPGAVNGNVEWFAARGIPCVVGTTGGDRAAMESAVRGAGVCAVIAANMGAPIIMMQAAMEHLARTFPGALMGWKAEVRESHQATKKDTSGTAKAMAAHIARLGMEFGVGDIEMVRDPRRQREELGVPEEHINGHAYHSYTFTSPDGSVTLNLTHNVLGRAVYAEGTATAVKFLARRMSEGRKAEVYSMVDALRGAEHAECTEKR